MRRKILYLYSELMGYQIPVFNEYVNKFNCEVWVIHDVKGKLTKYKAPDIDGVQFMDMDLFTDKELKKFVLSLAPDIVYVSGWMYWKYLKVLYHLRKLDIPVLVGFDDIWWKTPKQRLASIIFPLIKNKFFSHAWVAGPYQYEYARRLGFESKNIVFNCLSADIGMFNSFYHKRKQHQISLPRHFLYVGRLSEEKGVDLLFEAWDRIKEHRKGWKLTAIGNGTLLDELKEHKDIEIIDFLQPADLINKLYSYGCLIIPSKKEQWSLVMHEFSAAGFPIVVSNVCGALPLFVVHNYNGFVFSSLSVQGLADQMIKIIQLSENELTIMSNRSHELGQRITPEIAAASFLSVLS